ncbi:MAG: methyltransferase domain-containing protein [Thermoplasmata archaeon]|nr:methyltransferase domain-containing protein [Thermoplasmata archaeon]
MTRRAPTHWSETIFLDHSSEYAEVLRASIPAARPEVEGVRRILVERGIAPGSRILDIACGIGRDIVPLGQAGFDVVGCDLSPGFVKEARQWARREGLPPSRARFHIADYRSLGPPLRAAHERPFDAAICLFTSMGFRGRSSDLAVFRSLRSWVRPGGIFVFETGDRDSIVRRFQPVGISRTASGLEIHERREFDWESSTMHSTWTYYRQQRRGHLRRLFETEITVRLYSLHEIKELFDESGWKFRQAYGSLSGSEPVSFDSRRLAVVLQRPKA